MFTVFCFTRLKKHLHHSAHVHCLGKAGMSLIMKVFEPCMRERRQVTDTDKQSSPLHLGICSYLF
jgi:hypothetical protein